MTEQQPSTLSIFFFHFFMIILTPFTIHSASLVVSYIVCIKFVYLFNIIICIRSNSIVVRYQDREKQKITTTNDTYTDRYTIFLSDLAISIILDHFFLNEFALQDNDFFSTTIGFDLSHDGCDRYTFEDENKKKIRKSCKS